MIPCYRLLTTARGAQNVVEKLELGKKIQVLVSYSLSCDCVTQETETKKGPGASSGDKAGPLSLQVREQYFPTNPVLLQLNTAFPPEDIISGEDQRLCMDAFKASCAVDTQAPPPMS